MRIKEVKCHNLHYSQFERIIQGLIRNYYRSLVFKDNGIKDIPVVVFATPYENVSELYNSYFHVIKELLTKERLTKLFELEPHDSMQEELKYFQVHNIEYDTIINDIKNIYGIAEAVVMKKELYKQGTTRAIIISINNLEFIEDISNIYDLCFVSELFRSNFVGKIRTIVKDVSKNTDFTNSKVSTDISTTFDLFYRGNDDYDLLEMAIRHADELRN